jgi:hypothetical protein
LATTIGVFRYNPTRFGHRNLALVNRPHRFFQGVALRIVLVERKIN